eukprot:PhF_6_TR39093/c0_g1_i1/m.58506
MNYLIVVVLCFVVGTNGIGGVLKPIPTTTPQPTYTDDQYQAMQKTLLHIMDGVTGHDFVWNWINVLSEDVTVCYPFVGIIDPTHCLFGKEAVIKQWGVGIGVQSTAIQQEEFWLTKYPATGDTMAVWKYTTSSSYVAPSNTTSCAVQFGGTVMWVLDPNNATLISKWLETPQSDRISQTYPCKL